MTVHLGAVSFGGAGALSVNLREQKQRITATFAGAGDLSVNLREQRHHAAAIFAGAGSFSAVDTVIQAEVSFLATSFLQAVADRGLADMVGDPKARLVIAVEIDLLPIS